MPLISNTLGTDRRQYVALNSRSVIRIIGVIIGFYWGTPSPSSWWAAGSKLSFPLYFILVYIERFYDNLDHYDNEKLVMEILYEQTCT